MVSNFYHHDHKELLKRICENVASGYFGVCGTGIPCRIRGSLPLLIKENNGIWYVNGRVDWTLRASKNWGIFYVCCNFGDLNLFNVFLGLSESFWIFVLCFGNGFVSNFNFLFIKITYIYNWSGECGIDLIIRLEIGLIIEFITWVGLSITWLFS